MDTLVASESPSTMAIHPSTQMAKSGAKLASKRYFMCMRCSFLVLMCAILAFSLSFYQSLSFVLLEDRPTDFVPTLPTTTSLMEAEQKSEVRSELISIAALLKHEEPEETPMMPTTVSAPNDAATSPNPTTRNTASELSGAISQSKNRTPRVFGLTYGTAPYEKALNRIKDEADKSQLFTSFDVFRTEDLEPSFREHFKDILNMKRGGGYWIYKVHLIQRYLKRIEYEDILVFLDAGCKIYKKGTDRFWWYVEQLQRKNKSILAFQMEHHLEEIWTTDALFNYFNVTRGTPLWKKVARKGQHIGGILIMRKTPALERMMATYNQTLYKDPYLFTDHYNNATKAKRGRFYDHRHDQSVFSVIRKLYPEDTLVIRDETYKPKTDVPFVAARARGFSRRKQRLERERLAHERLKLERRQKGQSNQTRHT